MTARRTAPASCCGRWKRKSQSMIENTRTSARPAGSSGKPRGERAPGARQEARDYERVLAQRNAALEAGRNDIEAWDERFVELGARLRHRRADYARRLRAALRNGGAFAGGLDHFKDRTVAEDRARK